jgi:hypothetical protein
VYQVHNGIGIKVNTDLEARIDSNGDTAADPLKNPAEL